MLSDTGNALRYYKMLKYQESKMAAIIFQKIVVTRMSCLRLVNKF